MMVDETASTLRDYLIRGLTSVSVLSLRCEYEIKPALLGGSVTEAKALGHGQQPLFPV